MRAGRLLEMEISEASCRARQEAWKWWDRIAAPRRKNGGLPDSPRRHDKDPSWALIRDRIWKGSAETALAASGQNGDRRSARFFIGVEGRDGPTLPAGLPPGEKQRLLNDAEALGGRRFDLLGYRDLSFGDPIDWHLDPISGKRAPFVHWSKLDPLNLDDVGDSKVIWELNRHQWFVRLGQAYLLTGDERHARIFAESFKSWIESNPPGMGINWASSLEAALRIVAWSWAVFLFHGSRTLTSELTMAVLAAIRIHATHVEKYLSYYFSPNTHLTGEALGLFYAGILFPEARAAARWRKLGERILLEEIERQVHADGVYFEQATCYQRYTVEIYLHYFLLAKGNGLVVPAIVLDRIQKMIDFLIAVRSPDGSIPQIGDSDGGWLLPLTSRAPDDLRGLFAVAAALFGRRDYAWAAAGHA